MKRIMLSLVVVLVVAAVGFGSAASMGTVTTDHLGATTAQVIGAPAGATVSWETFVAGGVGSHGPAVSAVDIDFHSTANAGDYVLMRLSQDANFTTGAQPTAMVLGKVSNGGVAICNAWYVAGTGWVKGGTDNAYAWADQVNYITVVVKGSLTPSDGTPPAVLPIP